ncbi:Protein of unknown function DUF2555 [Thalassoporum mexicanum PCC 7367]|uniref:protein IsiD n=1 Tax=Thalassoporum mexicanum TaxID=3457544 RepID=UPI00029FD522|nr:DUF2555 domain-containing protein [Pseudanabaena sp. PCC 7367]AFY70271.1 Protein of unknown function DUF2555 [Pseudanabaena sp. PCC 7367]
MSTKQASEVTEVDIEKLTPEDVAELAERLEKDDYDNPFEGLKDWHLLRSLAFTRSELIEGYYHLLDLEEYDEC